MTALNSSHLPVLWLRTATEIFVEAYPTKGVSMQVTKLSIPEVILFEPKVYTDERGFFYESFNSRIFQKVTGLKRNFVQDNHSCSAKNVLRGLHYQIKHPQGKLVRIVTGEVFDVAVDIRKSSPTFGSWVGITLSAENKRIMWVPEGFAHGFLVLSDAAEFIYKTTDYWAQEFERTICWNDPTLLVKWPLLGPPIVSIKDALGVKYASAECFE